MTSAPKQAILAAERSHTPLAFDPVLEIFRLGDLDGNKCLNVPEIRRPCIPYWSESLELISGKDLEDGTVASHLDILS